MESRPYLQVSVGKERNNMAKVPMAVVVALLYEVMF